MPDDMTASAPLPAGLRTDAPPEDGCQIVAWAVDLSGKDSATVDDAPRWVIAQFVPAYPGGRPYWQWAVPGRVTRVEILGWLPLPCLDGPGRHAAARGGPAAGKTAPEPVAGGAARARDRPARADGPAGEAALAADDQGKLAIPPGMPHYCDSGGEVVFGRWWWQGNGADV
jgi:hypothetical protein